MDSAKILVVDDDGLILAIVKDKLTEAGFMVKTATSGKEALETLKTYHPALIILDVEMPGIDGFEVTHRLRKEPETAFIPIIMLTSKGDIEDKATGFRAGIDDYLTKPFDPIELELRVKVQIAKAKAARPEMTEPQGLVISLFSLRGGAGVTSIAVNLAVALAQMRQVEVPLIDLALESGHDAMMLDLKPQHTLAELAQQELDDIDSEMLDGYLTTHPSGVRVLPAPDSAALAGLVQPSLIQRVLTDLKDRYEYSVVDTPSSFTEVTLTAFDLSDLIFLVVTPEVACLKATTNTLDILESLGYRDERLAAVVNYTCPRSSLSLQQIEDSLDVPIIAAIPYHSGLFVQAINQGTPFIVSDPEGQVSTIIQQIASQVSKPKRQPGTQKVPSSILLGKTGYPEGGEGKVT